MLTGLFVTVLVPIAAIFVISTEVSTRWATIRAVLSRGEMK